MEWVFSTKLMISQSSFTQFELQKPLNYTVMKMAMGESGERKDKIGTQTRFLYADKFSYAMCSLLDDFRNDLSRKLIADLSTLLPVRWAKHAPVWNDWIWIFFHI